MGRTNSINLRINSFASFDDAMDMCDLLSKETGEKYTVMPDNHLGFTANRVDSNHQIKLGINNEFGLKGRNFRQAWRGFVTNFLQILSGMMIFFKPYKVISWVFALVDINEIPEWLSLKGAGELVGIFGVLVILHGMRFIYSYFSEKLFFDEDGVVHRRGIIAQTQVQIRFGDIKTIGVTQGILERFLGIGSIHLDSAGTNGEVDIEFKNIIDPISMRRDIQRLIDDYIKLHG